MEITKSLLSENYSLRLLRLQDSSSYTCGHFYLTQVIISLITPHECPLNKALKLIKLITIMIK